MLYEQSIESCFAEGPGQAGMSRAGFAAALDRLKAMQDRLRAADRAGDHPILSLARRDDDLAALNDHGRRFAAANRAVVVLGTGGSSLGARTLVALADQGFGPPPDFPKLHFLDNLDAEALTATLAHLDPAATGFLLVSKSGGTVETMAQALIAIDWLKRRLGSDAVAARLLGISEPRDNPLRRLAKRWGFPVLDHDPELGGRFSVFSLVGVLPALLQGLDAAGLRAGAAAALDRALTVAIEHSPPAQGAAIAVGLAEARGIGANVFFAYGNRLQPFAQWYRQLWAESLGKAGKGTAPIAALGPVDQHSQLQFYLDGPNDKFYTLILPATEGSGPLIDLADADNDAALAYLKGRSLGDVTAAEGRATAAALIQRGRPVRVIRVETLDERSLGALLMHFIIETLFAAELFGVDPFGQPAVEEGKVLARRYLAEGSP